MSFSLETANEDGAVDTVGEIEDIVNGMRF